MKSGWRIEACVELARAQAAGAPWKAWRALLAGSETEVFADWFVDYAIGAAKTASAHRHGPMLCGFALWRGLDGLLDDPGLETLAAAERSGSWRADPDGGMSAEALERIKAQARVVDAGRIKNQVLAAMKRACRDAAPPWVAELFDAWDAKKAPGLLLDLGLRARRSAGALSAEALGESIEDVAPAWLGLPWQEIVLAVADRLARRAGANRDAGLRLLRESPGAGALWSGFGDGGERAGKHMGKLVLERLDKMSPSDAEAIIDGVVVEAMEFAGGRESLAGKSMAKAWMESPEGEALLWSARMHPDPLEAAKKITIFGSESMPTGRLGRAMHSRWAARAMASVERSEIEASAGPASTVARAGARI